MSHSLFGVSLLSFHGDFRDSLMEFMRVLTELTNVGRNVSIFSGMVDHVCFFWEPNIEMLKRIHAKLDILPTTLE